MHPELHLKYMVQRCVLLGLSVEALILIVTVYICFVIMLV